jgi:hypothetical protein
MLRLWPEEFNSPEVFKAAIKEAYIKTTSDHNDLLDSN